MIDITTQLNAFWSGERPDVIPYTIYWWEWRTVQDDPAWQAMFEAGLGYTKHVSPVKEIAPDVETIEDSYLENGERINRVMMRSPVGDVCATWAHGWNRKFWLETADDYRVMTWIIEHTRLEPDFESFMAEDEQAKPFGVAMPFAGRTPMQRILVDYTGLESFAVHLFDYAAEMMALYDALLRQFRRRIQLVAEGPGRFVSVLENFTAETMGPARFRQFHVPVYEELFPLLHQAGKIVGTHYDGRLAACRDAIATAPVDLIESFTTPPEGDMTLTEARAAWPDKLLWSNINVSTYNLPPEQLRNTVHDMVTQGSASGTRIAFEVSEHLPRNWRESMPVVLNALREISSQKSVSSR
jgi:hypothetical protein